jgi:hypothetical protein
MPTPPDLPEWLQNKSTRRIGVRTQLRRTMSAFRYRRHFHRAKFDRGMRQGAAKTSCRDFRLLNLLGLRKFELMVSRVLLFGEPVSTIAVAVVR